MKTITETEIYAITEKSYKVSAKIQQVLTGKAGKNVTADLAPKIDAVVRAYRNQVVALKAQEAIDKGLIQFVYGDPNVMLPPFMPFVRYQGKDSIPHVVFDLSYTTYTEKEDRSGAKTVDIDLRQLFSIMTTCYLVLDMDKQTVLPPMVYQVTAKWWAMMFCKVLNRSLALNTNRDRYDAFQYFAMQYYLQNILGLDPVLATPAAVANLKNGKNPFIKDIEATLAIKEINMYESFETFCHALFDNSVTGVGGIHTDAAMNMTTFIASFIRMYDVKCLYTLATFPYFLYVIISANNQDRGFNRRILEDVMIEPRMYEKMMLELCK